MKKLEGYDDGIILKIWDGDTGSLQLVPLSETIQQLAEYMGITIVEVDQKVKVIKRMKLDK